MTDKSLNSDYLEVLSIYVRPNFNNVNTSRPDQVNDLTKACIAEALKISEDNGCNVYVEHNGGFIRVDMRDTVNMFMASKPVQRS